MPSRRRGGDFTLQGGRTRTLPTGDLMKLSDGTTILFAGLTQTIF